MPNALKLLPQWLVEVIRGAPRPVGRRDSTRPFLVIGHRGAPCFEVENTLASFRRAVEQDGANRLEFDLCFTRDEQLVL
jgi:glycerophosphoryl diester phosphodiesterase